MKPVLTGSSPWEELVRLLRAEKTFDTPFVDAAEAAMAGLAVQNKVAQNGLILQEGDPLNHVHLLLRGSIYILRYTTEGRRIIPDVLEPPQILGLAEALQEESCYKASVRALTPCTLLQIPQAEILLAAEKSSSLSRYLLEYLAILAGKLMENSGQKLATAGKDTLLLYLHHQAVTKNLPIEIGENKNFLADRLGIHTRTLYRYLKELEEEKILRRVGQSIVLGKDNCKRLSDEIQKRGLW